MKKVILTKTNEAPITITRTTMAPKRIIFIPNGISSTYEQRKSIQPIYQELFRALFKIPDKQVQQRVMDAINGWETPVQCSKCSIERKNASTQTEYNFEEIPKFIKIKTKSNDFILATKEGKNTIPRYYIKGESLVPKRATATNTPMQAVCPATNTGTSKVSSPTDTSTSPSKSEAKQGTSEAQPNRRKRRRKICVPQVVKRSIAQQLYQAGQPKLIVNNQERKYVKETSISLIGNSENSNENEDRSVAKRPRMDSICSLGFMDNLDNLDLSGVIDMLDEFLPEPHNKNPQTIVRETMAREFLKAEKFKEGLLPIHEAVLENEIDMLKRQIWVWTKLKKVDLNDLLTQEDEDCLQLAVTTNRNPDIIETLLEYGLHSNVLDACGNNIIHLAILNNVEANSFAVLLQRIDINILSQVNDDGYSPLHLAVREDLHLIAEQLLNAIDERVCGKLLYWREAKKELSKRDFGEFYKQAFGRTDFDTFKDFNSVSKRKVLDCRDLKTGSTALSLAIEFHYPHLVFLLLAHLSDPRAEKICGTNVREYFTEVNRTLPEAIKIDRVMDKVISTLNKKFP